MPASQDHDKLSLRQGANARFIFVIHVGLNVLMRILGLVSRELSWETFDVNLENQTLENDGNTVLAKTQSLDDIKISDADPRSLCDS